jgi:hypothetical protein
MPPTQVDPLHATIAEDDLIATQPPAREPALKA